MFLPIVPSLQHSSIYGALPSMWVGKDAPSGAGYFARVGIGSTYVRNVGAGDVRVYTKVANTGSAADWVVAAGSNASKGYADIHISDLRELATGSFINAAGHGGLLASDTTPALNTINGDTDGAWRISWAGGNSDAVGFNITLPPDFDPTQVVNLKVRAAMAGVTNTCQLSCDVYWNEAFTKKTYAPNPGAKVTTATYATYTVPFLAADIPAAARMLSVEITPGAHATDALYITGIWIEYTRK